MTQSEIRMMAAEFVKSRRVTLNITQQQLAADCGVDQATISAIEGGRTGINDKMLAKLTEALHFHPRDLFSNPTPTRSERNLKMVS